MNFGRGWSRLALLVGAILFGLLPGYAGAVVPPVDPIESAVRDLNSTVPASAQFEASAKVRFVPTPDGGYEPVLEPEVAGETAGSAVVGTLLDTVGDLSQLACGLAEDEQECAAPGLAQCHAGLSLTWAYERGVGRLVTEQTNQGLGGVDCPSGVTGTAGVFVTTYIRDNGVAGPLGGVRDIKCPGFMTLPDLSTCEFTQSTVPNQASSARATQGVPIFLADVGSPEAHGVGSVYEFETQFTIHVPDLMNDVVVCARGTVLDPRDSMDFQGWSLSPCAF